MSTNKKGRLLRNSAFYLLLGIVLAILIARSYVYFGGNLSLGYGGVTFHHIFLGIILVLASGILFFSLNSSLNRNRAFMNILAFVFGFGAGLITDESNFLVSVGEYYNLANYYQPLNLYVDVTLMVVAAAMLLYSFFKRD